MSNSTLGHLTAVAEGEFVQKRSRVFDKACLQSRQNHSSENSPAIGPKKQTKKKSLAFVFEWCFFNNNKKTIKVKKKVVLQRAQYKQGEMHRGKCRQSPSQLQFRPEAKLTYKSWLLLLLQCFFFFYVFVLSLHKDDAMSRFLRGYLAVLDTEMCRQRETSDIFLLFCNTTLKRYEQSDQIFQLKNWDTQQKTNIQANKF